MAHVIKVIVKLKGKPFLIPIKSEINSLIDYINKIIGSKNLLIIENLKNV